MQDLRTVVAAILNARIFSRFFSFRMASENIYINIYLNYTTKAS